jgi:hypothetical protein
MVGSESSGPSPEAAAVLGTAGCGQRLGLGRGRSRYVAAAASLAAGAGVVPLASESGDSLRVTATGSGTEKGNEIQRCWRLYELSCCASNGPDLLIRHASIISYS